MPINGGVYMTHWFLLQINYKSYVQLFMFMCNQIFIYNL